MHGTLYIEAHLLPTELMETHRVRNVSPCIYFSINTLAGYCNPANYRYSYDFIEHMCLKKKKLDVSEPECRINSFTGSNYEINIGSFG